LNEYDLTLESIPNIQNNFIDKLNEYDLTLESIPDIQNNLKLINNELETINDINTINTQNALKKISVQQEEIDELKYQIGEILLNQEEELDNLKIQIKRDTRRINADIHEIYDHIEVHRNPYNDSDNHNGIKFEYIAREVEPAPYPGFRVEDFVEYPELAKEAGIQGRVIIAAFINSKGIPENIYIVKGVFEQLDIAALNAVKQSRWTPAKQQGKSIGVWVNIPVSFKLK
jgi:TonB family protein